MISGLVTVAHINGRPTVILHYHGQLNLPDVVPRTMPLTVKTARALAHCLAEAAERVEEFEAAQIEGE
jgi:hypothetical protein